MPPVARNVTAQDKALAADWHKRIEAAIDRHKEAFKGFDVNRKLLRGIEPNRVESKATMRTNLHYANLAAIRPQIYAKDPDFSVKPKRGVPEDQLPAVLKFGETSELLLHELLIKRGKLKARAKRLLTSSYTTSVGWWKVSWQENKRTDALIQNQIKDIQDNLMRLDALKEEEADPPPGDNQDLTRAKLQETLAGLQAKAEVVTSRGPAVDFVMSEDILILDDSIREIQDYERSSAIAHRVWMSREQFKQRFGYECKKAKAYTESAATSAMTETKNGEKTRDLLCVYEVWEQASNRIFHLCTGEEGFCDEPTTPAWTAERWYPFFLLAFNQVDGAFFAPSDVELTKKLVEEYNTNRDDLVHDRKECLPTMVVRKGGSLTDEDIKNIRDREGVLLRFRPSNPPRARRHHPGQRRRQPADLQRHLDGRHGPTQAGELRHSAGSRRHRADPRRWRCEPRHSAEGQNRDRG